MERVGTLDQNFRTNTFSFSLVNIMLIICLSNIAFTMLMYVPATTNFFRIFLRIFVNIYWTLTIDFCTFTVVILWFLSSLLMCWVTLPSVHVLYQSYILGMEPTWSTHMILMYSWIFIESFCTYIHQWSWSTGFFLPSVLSSNLLLTSWCCWLYWRCLVMFFPFLFYGGALSNSS